MGAPEQEDGQLSARIQSKSPVIASLPDNSETCWAALSRTNERENNEDSYMYLALPMGPPPGVLDFIAVADGMGGHEYGEHASRETLRRVGLALFERLSLERAILPREGNDEQTGHLSEILWNALELANAYIKRMVKANGWGKSGSTFVAAAIKGEQVVAVNLGDSPMFYLPVGGHISQVTHDHTVAGVLLRAGMISPELARYHEGRGRLEFYVGVENLPRDPAIYQLTLKPGDMLLLCSDGVSGPFSPEEIEAILRDPGLSLTDKAVRLMDAAKEKGETDNQTLILWRHEPPAGGAQVPGPIHPSEAIVPPVSSTEQPQHKEVPSSGSRTWELFRTKPVSDSK